MSRSRRTGDRRRPARSCGALATRATRRASARARQCCASRTGPSLCAARRPTTESAHPHVLGQARTHHKIDRKGQGAGAPRQRRRLGDVGEARRNAFAPYSLKPRGRRGLAPTKREQDSCPTSTRSTTRRRRLDVPKARRRRTTARTRRCCSRSSSATSRTRPCTRRKDPQQPWFEETMRPPTAYRVDAAQGREGRRRRRRARGRAPRCATSDSENRDGEVTARVERAPRVHTRATRRRRAAARAS